MRRGLYAEFLNNYKSPPPCSTGIIMTITIMTVVTDVTVFIPFLNIEG